MSNSLAIMTDAVHMLADVLGILFSLLALWLSTKPPSKKFTFGLHRLGECRDTRAPPDVCPPLASAPSVVVSTSRDGFKIQCLLLNIAEFIFVTLYAYLRNDG